MRSVPELVGQVPCCVQSYGNEARVAGRLLAPPRGSKKGQDTDIGPPGNLVQLVKDPATHGALGRRKEARGVDG